jgi:DNA-directed RNA polymerase specialized sigma24 family protein
MDGDTLNQRLSHISTLWTELFQAHAGSGEAESALRRALVLRYVGGVYRYLLGAVRDPDAAGELCHDFAVRFLRGDFQRASPQRGRFRDYLRAALINLVNDHHRARRQRPRPLPADVAAPAAPPAAEEDAFLVSWREELLARTWSALQQASTDQHAVLRFRIDNPELSSAQMAAELSKPLGRVLSAAWVRKTLQRAHARYADLLLAEVEDTLTAPTPDQLREELAALDLLRYCASALECRRA